MTTSSTRRYLSVWLRRLSTDRIERRLAARDDAPRLVAQAVRSAQRVVALNDAAAALGLSAGMGVADARAMHPAITVLEADPEADRTLLEAVADWCDRYTPLVGLDPPDGLLLDIAGCAHLFGGEAALVRDLVQRLARQGFHARAAVADTVGCAWGVCRYGDAGARLVGPEDTGRVVAGLPVAALRLEPGIVAGLTQSGLCIVGDLESRPRAPLAARFGGQLLRRLDQAFGREDEPIAPRLPVPDAVAEQPFPEPIGREEDVLGTIEQLADRIARVLERRGEGARLLQLALFRTDGTVHRLEIGTGAALRDPVRIRRLFQERLAVLGDACDPGFGFDLVRLSVVASERSDPVQTGLAGPDQTEELMHLVDRLGARFGLRRVSRLVLQDTHIPEFAVSTVPAHAARPARVMGGDWHPEWQDTLAAARPIRLFARPERIEATAEVPDGPPIQFSWRNVRHQVVRAEGPERIAMEWWRDATGEPLTRDYFRIECRSGLRAWLFRDGTFAEKKEQAEKENAEKEHQAFQPPHWYVHGLFA